MFVCSLLVVTEQLEGRHRRRKTKKRGMAKGARLEGEVKRNGGRGKGRKSGKERKRAEPLRGCDERVFPASQSGLVAEAAFTV